MVLRTALLGLLLAGVSLANQQARGYCQLGGQVVTTSGIPSSSKVQASYPLCTVNVYNAGTSTHSTIYSDNSNTPKSNPFTATSQAYWFFYAADGCYDITLSGGTPAMPIPFTLYDVCLNPGGGGGAVTSFNGRTGAVVPATGDYNSLKITGAAYTATFSTTPTFDLSQGTIQKLTLSGTVTGAFLTNIQTGLTYQFWICQDAPGNHDFSWPASVHGGMFVGRFGATCSAQYFLATDTSNLYALGPGVMNQ